MASIIKRKKNYSVVYNYVDENGETKQKWETWHTHKEALKRKAEIENQQHTGTFLPPSNQTITEFLYDFVGSVKPNRAVSPTGNNSRGAFFCLFRRSSRGFRRATSFANYLSQLSEFVEI